MRRVLTTFGAILMLVRAAFPQAAFEVATIRPVDTTNGVSDAGVRVYPGGRIVIHALPLKNLIVAAYGASYWQVSGGEAWVEKDVYDVEARPAAQSGSYSLRHTRFGIGDEKLRQMLQVLLAERFQVKVRRETTTGTVYSLERSGKPFLLHSTKYSEDKPVMGAPGFAGEIERTGGHWFLFNTSLAEVAKYASDFILHRPVIDRTGLEGSFDYREPDVVDEENGDLVGAFQVFIRDVGLRLTASKGPVESWVIEYAERPSGN